MSNIALIIAGGIGTRMNNDIPKQFLSINEKPVIVYTLEAFQKHMSIDDILVVCVEGWELILSAYAKQYSISKLTRIIPGGNTGYKSIQNGIFELEKYYRADDIIIIHDAIRPMLSQEVISDCVKNAQKYGSAIASLVCTEAILQTEDGVVSFGSYPRDKLKRAQTPQGFALGKICSVYRKAMKAGVSDSVTACTLFIEMGEQVYFSSGSEKNIKLTTMDDLDLLRLLLKTSN